MKLKPVLLSTINHKLSTNKGFTLIELLIVIAVLGVLAAAVVSAINPVKKINQAKDSTLKSDMGQIVNALQANVTVKNGAYPINLQALVTSGELKSVPNQPNNGPAYNYVRSADPACTTEPYTGCEAAVWGIAFDAATPSIYCWDSTTNTYKTGDAATPPTAATPVCPL